MLRGLAELADVVFPRECVVCGTDLSLDERYLCDSCLKDTPLTYFWLWKDNPAEQHLWARTRFERVVSLFFYSRDNAYSKLLHMIKYGGDRKLGLELGRLLGEYMLRSGITVDVILPVPLHWYRRWRRGYNQAEIIAEGISSGMGGIPIIYNALKRKKYSSSQTGKSMEEKWKNVSEAFALGRSSSVQSLQGKHILLVDDVLTSGATAEACYNALSAVPGVRISYATLACTVIDA